MGSNCDITILFGSQTGNSEDVAYKIGRHAKRRHKSVYISALDDYYVTRLPDEAFVIFVVATTGNGDPPDNMKNFWRFIWRSLLPSDSLAKVKYTVVGLGDSSYQKFNVIAKKLSKRLSQLGGDLYVPCCFGDDQHDLGYSAAINPWLTSFWECYLESHPIPNGFSILPANCMLPPKFSIDYTNDSSTVNAPTTILPSEAFCAPVICNRRVTSADHWQDVRLVAFDILESNARYAPGDVCYVYPKNSQLNVAKISELFQFDLDLPFVLKSDFLTSTIPLGQPCNLRFLLENCLDICGSPKQYFWEVLAAVADIESSEIDQGSEKSDERLQREHDLSMEREKLQEFLTPEGQDELFSYCYRPKRTILEVLTDFPQTRARLTLPYLLDIIHEMKPRAFSIASSQMKNPDQLEILVAVVSYKTRLVEPRRGLCSNYLASLVGGEDKVVIKVAKGTLKFPCGDEPVIMVGPGTGCAPFKSFVDQRTCLDIGGNYLVFGCRNSSKDFFFRDEWKAQEEQNLLKLFVAFSRDQEDKVYVQHLVEKNGSMLCDLLLNKRACFVLAGNSKNMPESVRDAVAKILSSHGQMDLLESESYISKMEREKRYQTEVWS